MDLAEYVNLPSFPIDLPTAHGKTFPEKLSCRYGKIGKPWESLPGKPSWEGPGKLQESVGKKWLLQSEGEVILA